MRELTLSEITDDLAGLNALMWAYMNNAINIGSPAEEEFENVSVFYMHASDEIIKRLRMIDGQSTE